jgi:DNA-binding SARP family transcriptional activator/tetratricopeptide (TPR) repeat protein
MWFQLLGEPQVHAPPQVSMMGPPKQAAVLASLLVDANRPLSAEVLVERVWGAQAHDRAARTLHTYVSRIRRLLAPAGAEVRLHRHRSGGYLLELSEETVDVHRFRQLVARAADDPRRVALLREAMALWHGPPLAGIPGDWAARVRTLLESERVDATVHWADAEIRSGDPASVLGPLTELTERFPLVEPLAAVRIRALDVVGRTAEALADFLAVRRRLVDELGVEPGAELRAAHREVLREQPPPERDEVVPAQLPRDVPDFVGRDAEQQRMHAALAAGFSGRSAATPVLVVSGTAGVGKSTLVVHWGHQVRRRFPDGQLYVDLLGFDPAGAALSAQDALRNLLLALAVPAARIPSGLEPRSALYRSVLADRRVLIVLDNAVTERDVRPLLPGAPQCLVVIASRNQLPGLVAAEGARPVELGLLPHAQARELLGRRVGAGRLAAEPAAVDEIVTACARLPLALTVAAARALLRPEQPLARLAAQLRAVRSDLDAFAEEDETTDVRAVLSWSYRALPADAARLFRLLGLHPGPDLALPAVAALLGEPVAAAERRLRALVRASLLAEHSPGRYTLHDLLRAYAGELVDEAEAAAPRRRMLDHYVHAALAADRLVYPHREPIEVAPPGPDVPVPVPADRAGALAWFAGEHQILVRMVRYAHDAGLNAEAWRLAWTLTTYFDLQGYWQDWVGTQQEAIDLFGRAGRHAAQARALNNCGWYHAQLGENDLALARCEEALRLHRRIGDRYGEANTRDSLGLAHHHLGDHERAIEEYREALRAWREVGDRYNEAGTLGRLGDTYRSVGSSSRARDVWRRALSILVGLGHADAGQIRRSLRELDRERA